MSVEVANSGKRSRREKRTSTSSCCCQRRRFMQLASLFIAARRAGTYAWLHSSLPPISIRNTPSCLYKQRILVDRVQQHSTPRTSAFVTRRLLSSDSDEAAQPAASDQNEQDDDDDKNNKRRKIKKKYKVVDKIEQRHLDNLAKAFDLLARKEGFDKDDAFFADDATFEDDFDEEDYDLVLPNEKDSVNKLDPSNFSIRDFEAQAYLEKYDNDDDDDDDDDMESRINAAQQDLDFDRVSVSPELDRLAATSAELRKLGFRPETDPFGIDETPRKGQFQLVTSAMTCSACGSDFQCHNEQRPGYLPPEKFEVQVKLKKIEEIQELQEKAGSAEWSPEDEIEWLIQTSDSKDKQTKPEDVADIDIDALAENMGLDLFELSSRKKVICKRCHGLQNFGKIDASLRPGWTKEPLLSQEKFRALLAPIREKPAVVIALVDLFDFSGSVLPELDNIAGENPVILAANKADLLPSSMGQGRIENWVRREMEYLGVKSIGNMGGAVRLVSCKTGLGVPGLLTKARSLADEMDCDIYVVGAANAGKSTLLNHILASPDDKPTGKTRAGNRNARKGAVTTSPMPGTTLKFIKVDIGGGTHLYDTPGLLVPSTLTQVLTPEELKIVVPKKQVEPITFRLSAGKCVLVGGLAKIELIGDSRPFLFTFFVANEIKLHPTDSSRSLEVLQKHVGEMLTPPLPPGEERLKQIGEFEDHVIDIEGMGWKEAAADIALTGLGWVAVTGAGTATVKVSLPKGIGISVRPPLMPFDVWETTAKYTGGRAVRKDTKSKSGKRRKGVGRS